MTGLTEAGFVAKRTPELKLELEQALLDLLGAVNLNPASVFGQLVGLDTDQKSALWALLEEVYWSQYPRSATGVNLDRMVSINGLSRLPAAPSVVRAVVTGSPVTNLFPGRLVSAPRLNTQFILLDTTVIEAARSVGARIVVNTVTASHDYTITVGATPKTYNSGGSPTEASILTGLAALYTGDPGINAVVTSDGTTAYLDLTYDTAQLITVSADLTLQRVSNYAIFASTTPGPLDVPIGAVTQIDTPVAGWFEVNNRHAGEAGRFTETDDELRARREISLKLAATGTLDAVVSHMQQVPGVLEQRILVNNSDTTDGNGTPAHHVWAIVEGGVPAEIAEVLYTQVAAGIGYRGDVEVVHISPITGAAYSVKFDRPTLTDFYVSVQIQSSPNTPADAVDRVRQALVDWAGDLRIGESVLWSRLFTPINAVIGDGAYVEELYLNTVPIVSPGDELTDNLDADPDERYTLQVSGVQVIVV